MSSTAMDSGGEASQMSEGTYLGMGWLERRDIARWVDDLAAKNPTAKIVLHGISMGGATVMMAAGEDLRGHVVAAVEDCGYTSVWDMIAAQAKVLHVPTFPVLNLTNFIAKNVAGYTLKEASSGNQLAHCKIPMLFFMARMTLSCRWPCSMRSMQLLNARSGASRCRGRLMRFLLRLRQNCIGARWGSFSPLGICDAERQAIRASSANKERGLYGDARCSSGDCCGRS